MNFGAKTTKVKLTQWAKWIIVVFNHQISPKGRVGGFHMLRCQGFEVKYYAFTLGRLAYESLRLVQDSSR